METGMTDLPLFPLSFAPLSTQPNRRLLRLLAGASLLALGLAAQSAQAQTAEAPAAPVQLPGIDVTGQATNTREDTAENGYRARTESVSPLGKVPLKDTPYSVNVTSGELIENSNAHSLADAVKTNPTASLLMSSGGYSSMTRLMVRGFTAADQSELRDGMVDRSFSYPPIENVDRIEVLNGFSGFFQGFSSPGGSVNYVSKAPTPTTQASLTLGDYGGGINFAQGDVGGPVDGTDGKLGYRLNAYKEGGQTYVDGSTQKRALGSAVVDYHFTPDTVVTADIWHQEYDATGLQTYFANQANGSWNGAISPVPSASAFNATKQYGESWTYNKAEKTLAGLRFDTKLNETFSLRTGYRHGDMWRQYDYVGAISLTPGGAYTKKETSTPRQFERTDSAYSLLDAHVDTWGVGHDLTAGYSGTYFFYERGADVTRILGNSNISSNNSFADPQLALGDSNQWSNTRYNNTLIGDRIKFTDQWSAVLGENHAELVSRAWTNAGVTKYSQSANTPTYALLFKPIPEITTYGSYMEGLATGGTAPTGTTNQNAMLAPSISKQYEVGAKATFGNIDLNAALFRIDKINEETDPGDNTYKQDGREIHQGLEFTATGKLTPSLTAIGGFTVMDAHISQAKADRLSEDKVPVNVPERQASAYLEYALPWIPDLTVIGGANYYGRRPVDTHNTAYLDDATIFNAGLRYEPEIYGHKTSINLNISNLFDTAYWAYYRSGDGLLIGAPRVVSLSLKTTW
jgi:iron complex outermembrane receptor protein